MANNSPTKSSQFSWTFLQEPITRVSTCLVGDGNKTINSQGKKILDIFHVPSGDYKKWKQDRDAMANSWFSWGKVQRVDVIVFLDAKERTKTDIPSFSIVHDRYGKKISDMINSCELYCDENDTDQMVVNIITLIKMLEKDALKMLADGVMDLISSGQQFHDTSLLLLQLMSSHHRELEQISNNLEKILSQYCLRIDKLKVNLEQAGSVMKEFYWMSKSSNEEKFSGTIQAMRTKLTIIAEEIGGVAAGFRMLCNDFKEDLEKLNLDFYKNLQEVTPTLSLLENRWYLLALSFSIVAGTIGAVKRIQSQVIDIKLLDTIGLVQSKCHNDWEKFSYELTKALTL